MYKVVEVHIMYNGLGRINFISVMWKSSPGVRATYCTTNPCAGYEFLKPDEDLTEKLIQKVCAAGMNLPDNLKEKIFPGITNWQR